MKNKKLSVMFLLVTLIFTLLLGFYAALFIAPPLSAGPCANGVCHLVWDQIDQFWWCIGSEVNCCCDFPQQ